MQATATRTLAGLCLLRAKRRQHRVQQRAVVGLLQARPLKQLQHAVKGQRAHPAQAGVRAVSKRGVKQDTAAQCTQPPDASPCCQPSCKAHLAAAPTGDSAAEATGLSQGARLAATSASVLAASACDSCRETGRKRCWRGVQRER